MTNLQLLVISFSGGAYLNQGRSAERSCSVEVLLGGRIVANYHHRLKASLDAVSLLTAGSDRISFWG
jgi:hypothetical protein